MIKMVKDFIVCPQCGQETYYPDSNGLCEVCSPIKTWEEQADRAKNVRRIRRKNGCCPHCGEHLEKDALIGLVNCGAGYCNKCESVIVVSLDMKG